MVLGPGEEARHSLQLQLRGASHYPAERRKPLCTRTAQLVRSLHILDVQLLQWTPQLLQPLQTTPIPYKRLSGP